MTPPITLLHGLGSTPAAWSRIRPTLQATGHTVVVPVLASSLGRIATIEQDADILTHQLGPEPTVVVGHSRGGLVATALAERHPLRVERLVLINTPPTPQSRISARRAGERALAVPILGEMVWRLMTPALIERGLSTAFAPGVTVPETFVRDLRATRRDSFVAATRSIDTYLTQRPLPARLACLPCPVRVVAGQLDQRVDPQSFHQLAGLPGVELTLLPRAGHTPIWEDPQAVAAIIIEESA